MSVVVAMIEYGARLSLRKHERVSSLGGPCLYDCLGIFWLLLLHLKPIIVTPLLLLLLLLLRREYSNLHTIHYQLLNQTFLQAPKSICSWLAALRIANTFAIPSKYGEWTVVGFVPRNSRYVD